MPPNRTSPTQLSTDSVHNFTRRNDPLRRTPTRRLPALLVATLCAVFAWEGSADEPAGPAASFLAFETVPDGKCQILSEGGKLTLLRNTHPSSTIRYRLVRLFVARPQGLMDGEIEPAESVQKLGCDRVGGRAQTWQVKRASFAQE